MPPGTDSARRARCSATRTLSASVSSTHGPAMRKNACVGKSATSVGGLHERRGRLPRRAAAALDLRRGGNEPREEGMRARGTRLELGMELATDEPWVRCELHDLDELSVGGNAAELHSVLHEQLAIRVRHRSEEHTPELQSRFG